MLFVANMASNITDLESKLLALTRQRIEIDSQWIAISEKLLAAKADLLEAQNQGMVYMHLIVGSEELTSSLKQKCSKSQKDQSPMQISLSRKRPIPALTFQALRKRFLPTMKPLKRSQHLQIHSNQKYQAKKSRPLSPEMRVSLLMSRGKIEPLILTPQMMTNIHIQPAKSLTKRLLLKHVFLPRLHLKEQTNKRSHHLLNVRSLHLLRLYR